MSRKEMSNMRLKRREIEFMKKKNETFNENKKDL